eukprot:CAMPEP_0115037716 /NCGR_PEP_ID=MMETSP0216-20121206/42977_1 /TAXON_ID=223996 /ORGANISM="Protocruzia adherens, Strain Boccale" /LENGTH=423 /DNA_ID=CAMNT_0002417975 /DNA_START=28 /DNA_END=1301 /DNA_ORIENTATION=-
MVDFFEKYGSNPVRNVSFDIEGTKFDKKKLEKVLVNNFFGHVKTLHEFKDAAFLKQHFTKNSITLDAGEEVDDIKLNVQLEDKNSFLFKIFQQKHVSTTEGAFFNFFNKFDSLSLSYSYNQRLNKKEFELKHVFPTLFRNRVHLELSYSKYMEQLDKNITELGSGPKLLLSTIDQKYYLKLESLGRMNDINIQRASNHIICNEVKPNNKNSVKVGYRNMSGGMLSGYYFDAATELATSRGDSKFVKSDMTMRKYFKMLSLNSLRVVLQTNLYTGAIYPLDNSKVYMNDLFFLDNISGFTSIGHRRTTEINNQQVFREGPALTVSANWEPNSISFPILFDHGIIPYFGVSAAYIPREDSVNRLKQLRTVQGAKQELNDHLRYSASFGFGWYVFNAIRIQMAYNAYVNYKASDVVSEFQITIGMD